MRTFEFELDGHRFQSQKLLPDDQLLVLKRVMPLLGPLIPLAQAAELTVSGKEEDALNLIASLIGPFSEAFGGIKDDDLRWLMDKCLSTLKIEQNEQWAPFWNRAARKSMFDDLADISLYLPLMVRVIQENLTPFFLARLTGRQALAKPPA